MGEDFWSYGVEPNRKVLDYFLGQHHAQGLSARRLSVGELFHPGTYELFSFRHPARRATEYDVVTHSPA